MASKGMWFGEQDLAGATDEGRMVRGEDYVRYVRALRVSDDRATASVQAKGVYRVELTWYDRRLAGTCTCADEATDLLCKHLVAVGLAVLEGTAEVESRAAEPIRAYLESLDHDQLIELITRLSDIGADVRTFVLARAAAAGHDDALDADELTDQVNQAIHARGFVDYRRSFEVAADAEAVLDRMSDLLDAGAADAVRPALLRAVTRLRAITLHADDSGGVLGGACQRAADLYARSCREGHPDPVPLARWLVRFRRDSPGWPVMRLADFAAALDDKAMRVYRRAVAKWSDQEQTGDRFGRLEVDRAVLELADHDHDLDAAIAILSSDPESTAYADIIERLVAAERVPEATGWLDRAVAAGRVSGRLARQRHEYWVDPERAVELYSRADRVDDALAVLRAGFLERPGAESWRVLLDFGAQIGAEEEQRRWALEQGEDLARRPYATGAHLVEIHLSEGRLDEAWHAAERFGAGHLWRQLADQSLGHRPADGANLYRPKIEELLRYADRQRYIEACDLLVDMRKLSMATDDTSTFDTYVSSIRERFARRPSLLAELARRGL